MLEIITLGSPSIRCDGIPVTELTTRKVEALLVYLACTRRVHSRELLAEMFWAERTQERSLGNLRVALTSLRKNLPDYVTITRETVTLNPEADIWLDAAELEEKLNAGRVEEAVDLYRGDFLEGFYVRACPAFEDWASTERERARRIVLQGLTQLVTQHTQQGSHEEGIICATRLLQIDPYMEEGHRQMMRLLVYTGRRGAALAQYETCRQILAEELDVTPEEETSALHELIRLGESESPSTPPTTIPGAEPGLKHPAFLESGDEELFHQPPVFVARERELVRLRGFLKRSLAGQGRVILVTGGPGRGKTALLGEFARQAMDAQPDLLVASGSCNAYSGIGDPYLPLREVMAMLTGEVETRWAAGTITREHAHRLWSSLPDTVQTLLEHGPNIIPALVPGPPLLTRCTAAAPDGTPWLQPLRELVARARAHSQGLEQSHFFQQLTNMLRALAEIHPLLLILDDLQWADAASMSLLFHLGRRIEGSRILIAGAYRPEEASLGRNGERHPLDKVVSELKRTYGDVWVNLTEVDVPEGRHFVDALLETESNSLPEEFATALFEHTGGHPLFTVELLRAMQERGDLVQADGVWVE
ncbi:BTAD domain-containing putative transcriptional regulator, partial [Chloroflexota bacterium]